MNTRVKTAGELKRMRRAGRVVAEVLEQLRRELKPGLTTRQLAESARRRMEELGAEAAFLGYDDFPDVICISVNDEIVHGVPGERQITSGDLVGLDFGASYQGMIADGAITVAVGKVSADQQRLLDGTQAALAAGVAQARAGNRVGDISHAIESVLRQHGLGVVEDLTGHGVGHEVHELPSIPNYGPAGHGMKLEAGMTLAIEPMATLGAAAIRYAADGKTITTTDGSAAAQFEHTVLVTAAAPEILTLPQL